MLEHWLWLAHRCGFPNDSKKLLLLQHFGSVEKAYSATVEEYCQIPDLPSSAMEALEDKSLEGCRKTVEYCQSHGIRILTYADDGYPKRLKNIFDPPLVLYYKGELPEFDAVPAIAIVGTRNASAYGMTVARRLGAEISRCGGLVVSGMADGIDRAAMSGALLVGSSTVGVLGCGADVIYPKKNRELFEDVERFGCILSEFEPGTPPIRWNFPKRNRIISGLSCAVVVAEAPEKSGALITARCALDQGRDVFAVPGNVDVPNSAGSNSLLKEGAGAVSCGWDVLSEYRTLFPEKIHRVTDPLPDRYPPSGAAQVAQTPAAPSKKNAEESVSPKKDIDNDGGTPYIDLTENLQRLSETERAIVLCLQTGERLVDEVIAQTGISSGKVLCALTMLELKRIISRLPGRQIRLRKPE